MPSTGTHPNPMVKIAGFVKAVVIGQGYDAGDNKMIDMTTGQLKDIKAA